MHTTLDTATPSVDVELEKHRKLRKERRALEPHGVEAAAVPPLEAGSARDAREAREAAVVVTVPTDLRITLDPHDPTGRRVRVTQTFVVESDAFEIVMPTEDREIVFGDFAGAGVSPQVTLDMIVVLAPGTPRQWVTGANLAFVVRRVDTTVFLRWPPVFDAGAPASVAVLTVDHTPRGSLTLSDEGFPELK